MTAHSVVLCALLLCVPPPPTDGVTPCPMSTPSTSPATEFPQPPNRQVTTPDSNSKAPDTGADADAGTGLLGPLSDCVAALEDEAFGGNDVEERADESEAPGEDMEPLPPAPSGSAGEDDGTEETSPQESSPAGPEVVSEAEPTTEPSSAPSAEPEPGQAEEGSAASVVAESPSPFPSPEPRPTENGTVSRSSDATRPTPPVDQDQDLGERPPSKKVEETQEMDPVDGLAFEEASATSAFGRVVGGTSTTLLFLLAAGTLGLRLAVGWPRFPPLYLGRRRLSGELDTH